MIKFEARVHLATVALVSFILAFLVARTFTTFFPSRVIITSGIHIHHFWFGIILLAVGGWLGINSRQKDVDLAAAILYGVGGGLIVDEVGLLLTFGDYWTELTWGILVVMLSEISVLILITRYRKQIQEELSEHLNRKWALTLGIFLTALAVPFVLQTDNLWVVVGFLCLTVAAVAIIVVFFILQRRRPLN